MTAYCRWLRAISWTLVACVAVLVVLNPGIVWWHVL